MAFVCRVRTVLNGWSGAPGLSTTYYTDETGTIPSLAAAQNMVDHVRAGWDAFKAALSSAQTAQVNPVVDVIETSTGILATQTTVTPVAVVTGTGASTVGPAPAGVCLNFTTSTVVNGRVVRGRTFLSPLAYGSDANGTPNAGTLTAANAYGAAVIGSGTPVIIQVVWHRPVAGTGGVAAPVVGHVVADRFAVLRSRRA